MTKVVVVPPPPPPKCESVVIVYDTQLAGFLAASVFIGLEEQLLELHLCSHVPCCSCSRFAEYIPASSFVYCSARACAVLFSGFDRRTGIMSVVCFLFPPILFGVLFLHVPFCARRDDRCGLRYVLKASR